MSTKLSDDNGEQQKRNPDSTFHNEVPAKHAKLTSSTDTTLLDLPLELHEHILLEAIVSEIRDRKLVRCAWKDSADRLAERLRNVCPQWDSVLTSNSFQNRLHAIIDTYPSVELRLNMPSYLRFSTWCIAVDALDEEYFLLCLPPKKHAVIRICGRDDLEKARKLIQLPAVTDPWNLMACSVSSCVYVLHKAPDSVEILRVSKEDQQYQVVSFITCSAQLVSRMCVSADGSLIVYQGPAPSTITTYNTDGLIQRQIELTKPLSLVRDIISKSNGNVIMVSSSLTEISIDGDVLYDYNTRTDGGFRGQICCAVDMCDKILTVDVGHSVRLLDSDFNKAQVKLSRFAGIRCWKNLYKLHYNRQRDEFLLLDCCEADAAVTRRHNQVVKVFNVTETIISEGHVPWDQQDNIHVKLLVEGEVQNVEEAEFVEEPPDEEDSHDEGDSENEEDSQSEEDSQNEEN